MIKILNILLVRFKEEIRLIVLVVLEWLQEAGAAEVVWIRHLFFHLTLL